MDTNINRVYVNPNFNRMPARALQTSDPISSHHLYVNRNFARNITDVQKFPNSNRKIYVNPNFIKTTNNLGSNEHNSSSIDIKYDTESIVDSSYRINGYSIPECNVERNKISENISTRPSSKSRYRLIRRNDIEVSQTQRYGQESCTIKINKYKSIPIKNFKNNLQIVKNENTKQIFSKSASNNSVQHYGNRNCFKLVRYNVKTPINTSSKLAPKTNSLKIKTNIDLKFKLKLKVSNGIRKKNNMPCRLFMKYGKCLRNLYGTCEYLHDKKHVSLCRKFIKGICHDKQCLLSHELSSKKMPTCFFYLNGMCTKNDCPYLHVKLNDKSKICQNFLKGYCDKGDMCLHRHVRQINKNDDKKCFALNKHSLNRSKKLITSKSIKYNQLKRLPESINIKTKLENRPNEKDIVDSDCRYFKDLQNREAMCQVLKPTRCKLGTLPSFIRL